MPRFASDEDSLIAGVAERWWDEVPVLVHDNGRRPGPDYVKKGHFERETNILWSWVARKFPKVDPDALQRVCAAVIAQYNGDRASHESALEGDLDQAGKLCQLILDDIVSRVDSAGTTKGHEANDSALNASQRLVLMALLRRDHELLTVAEIESSPENSGASKRKERTIKTAIRTLIELGMVHRPAGDKRGAVLTPNGRKVAEQIAGNAAP
jgi:hypothetical protein